MTSWYCYARIKNDKPDIGDDWEEIGTRIWIGAFPVGDERYGFWSVLCQKKKKPKKKKTS
jgi:hypothetical protein